MSFKGYRYKFKINASHSININNEKGNIHFHTIDIAVYVLLKDKEFILYDDVENIIGRYLEKYSGRYLNEMEPFNIIEPTIENIGHEFYKNIRSILLNNNFEISRMEISEIPTRIYVITGDEVSVENNSINEEVINISKEKTELSDSFKIEQNDLKKAADNIIFPQPFSYKKVDDFLEQKDDNAASNSDKSVSVENTNYDSINIKINLNSEKKIGKMSIEKKQIFKMSRNLKIILSLIFIIICSVSTTLYVKNSGIYPTGYDVYGHLFKSNVLFENLSSGNLYPLYTKYWYNGIQPFRYWAPFPYYVLAFLQWMAGGQVMHGYLLFIGSSVLFGAMGFLKFGVRSNRILLCTILGVLWFFMPDNARIFFSEGNIPRMTIAILLPYLFYYVWDYIESRRKRNIYFIIAIMSLIILCHVMVAAMVGIASFVFCVIYSVLNKRYIESVETIIAMLLSFALVGIWLFPALNGGLLSMDSSSTSNVMKALSSKAIESLNPFLREQGYFDIYYYGISIIAISFVGLVVGNRKTIPGFVTAVLIFFGTTTALVPLIAKLPLNQLLWMIRFTPIAYALFFISIIEWKNCRKIFVILSCFVLILDSYPIINTYKNMYTMSRRDMQDAPQRYSLKKAKEITSQRLAIYDISKFGSYPSYYVTSDDNGERKIQYSYGWAWQGAATSHNIVMLNTSLEKGYYNYLFDRSIEMGCDTVIINRNQFENQNEELKKLIISAELSGYKFVEDSDMSFLFKLNTPETFGVITKYEGLAIGSSARSITLHYPSFNEGNSYIIDDYTFEELKQYKKIYLSGFTYRNKEESEELLLRLSESGTKIYIDMNRIPADKITNRLDFLGVQAQPITFTNTFPDLNYKGHQIKCRDFDEEYSTWNTVYLTGVNSIIGYSDYESGKLTFAGTGKNDNMIFLGFNLLYHQMETEDEGVDNILNDLFKSSENNIPQRKIIPIDIEYDNKKIIINSNEDNVNTTIAFQDIFSSSDEIINNNSLLTVNEGLTEVNISYPYLIQGIIISLIGVLGIIILSLRMNNRIFRK